MHQVIVFYFAIVIACIFSVIFSFKSRRATDPTVRGLNAARMNISMGILLILAALVQFILFEPDTIRIIIGSLFLLIGLFNLFAGLRSHGYFLRMK